jgi:hypothetical protein
MPKSQKPRSPRTFIFDKRFFTVAAAIAAALGGLAYFRNDLPMLTFSSTGSQQTARDLPNGSILIPYGDGICRLNEAIRRRSIPLHRPVTLSGHFARAAIACSAAATPVR